VESAAFWGTGWLDGMALQTSEMCLSCMAMSYLCPKQSADGIAWQRRSVGGDSKLKHDITAN